MEISEVMPNGNVRVVVPIALRTVRQAKRIVIAENETAILTQTPLLISIAKAFLWQQWLDEGMVKNVQELAKFLGKDRSMVCHTLQLTLLSPKIIHLAISGQLPAEASIASFRKAVPPDWEEQEKLLKIK